MSDCETRLLLIEALHCLRGAAFGVGLSAVPLEDARALIDRIADHLGEAHG